MREIKRSFDPETKTTEMQVLDPRGSRSTSSSWTTWA